MKILKSIPKLNATLDPKTTPLHGISVAIPHYDCQKYLLETLDSVYKARIPNMEILVVDDQTPNFNLRKFLDLNGYSEVRAYVNHENLGSFATFNECIKLSSCELIHVLHADDTVRNNFYSEISRVFNKSSGLDAIFCAAEIINHNSCSLNEISPCEPFEASLRIKFS